MASSTRIPFGATSLVGLHLANGVRYTLLAQQEVLRAKQAMDSISGNGVTPANLDNSTDVGSPGAGNGAVLYSATVTLNTALQGINVALLSNLDPG